MKKILFAAAMLLLASTAVQAQREIVRLTRYDGQTITGVAASDMFRVELIQSTQTKAVVELDADLEQYLRFERRPDGVVSVKLAIPESYSGDRWRHLRDRALKLTVYLPEIHSINLQDMARLTGNGMFPGGTTRIETGDMSRIDRLDLQVEEVSVKVSDMSRLTVTGTAREARAEVSDMSSFTGTGLRVERAHLTASDMSKVSIYVSQYLYGRSRGMSSIRYQGNPREVDLQTPNRTVNIVR